MMEMSVDARKLGAEFKRIRLSLGLTLDVVATRVGTTKSSIWGLEHGTNDPSITRCCKVANALGTDLWRILRDMEGRKE